MSDASPLSQTAVSVRALVPANKSEIAALTAALDSRGTSEEERAAALERLDARLMVEIDLDVVVHLDGSRTLAGARVVGVGPLDLSGIGEEPWEHP